MWGQSLPRGKVLWFFFVSVAFPWFELLCHISPFRVSSGHSTPVLILRTDDAVYLLTQPPISVGPRKCVNLQAQENV